MKTTAKIYGFRLASGEWIYFWKGRGRFAALDESVVRRLSPGKADAFLLGDLRLRPVDHVMGKGCARRFVVMRESRFARLVARFYRFFPKLHAVLGRIEARFFGVDYRLLDARERLAEAPMKQKDLFRDYLERIESGDKKTKPPRIWSDKWKPKD